MGKHCARAPRPLGWIRSLIVTSLVLAAAVVLATAGAGGTYALLSARAPIGSGATVTAGSSSLSVNGVSTFAAGHLTTGGLGPGTSVVTPVRVTNTGTTPLRFTASAVSVTSTQELARYLTLGLTLVAPGTTCTPGLAGGVSGTLASFSTAATPVQLSVGQEVHVCLQVGLNSDAPSSVQGGTASFTLLLDAIQVL